MSRRTQIDDFVTSLALVVLGVGANSMLEFVTLTSIPRISTTEGDAGGTGFGFGGGLTRAREKREEDLWERLTPERREDVEVAVSNLPG